MKNHPEDDLLNDVFPKSRDFRAASLEQMLCSARRQRRRRTVVRAGGIASVCLALSLFLLNSRMESDRLTPQVASVPTEANFPTVPGTSIRILSDEELLTMFANRPVALIGSPEERQFVVLDEIRPAKPTGLLN